MKRYVLTAIFAFSLTIIASAQGRVTVLRLGNEKKIKFSFCNSLDFL